MPQTKITALRDMTHDELSQRSKELKDEMFNLQMRRTLKPLDNPLRLRFIRRELARINTVLAEDRRGIRSISDAKVSLLGEKKKIAN